MTFRRIKELTYLLKECKKLQCAPTHSEARRSSFEHKKLRFFSNSPGFPLENHHALWLILNVLKSARFRDAVHFPPVSAELVSVGFEVRKHYHVGRVGRG